MLALLVGGTSHLTHHTADEAPALRKLASSAAAACKIGRPPSWSAELGPGSSPTLSPPRVAEWRSGEGLQGFLLRSSGR